MRFVLNSAKPLRVTRPWAHVGSVHVGLIAWRHGKGSAVHLSKVLGLVARDEVVDYARFCFYASRFSKSNSVVGFEPACSVNAIALALLPGMQTALRFDQCDELTMSGISVR